MELCDITLTAGNVSFSAHRLILAGNSPYFRNMFVSENADSRQQEVVLPSNCRGDSLRMILDYFYSGKLSINQEYCEDLLSLASLLQVCYNFSSIQSIIFSICIPKCFLTNILPPRSRLSSAAETIWSVQQQGKSVRFYIAFQYRVKNEARESMFRAIGKRKLFSCINICLMLKYIACHFVMIYSNPISFDGDCLFQTETRFGKLLLIT